MKRRVTKITAVTSILMLVLAAVVNFFIYLGVAKAANPSLTYAFVRLDRMAAATPTTGTICVNPTSSVAASGKIMITFPSTGSWTVASSASWTVDTINKAWPTSGTAWTGVTSGIASGQTVTFSGGGAMNNGTLYCFNWSNSAALTTGTAASNQIGTLETQNSGAVQIDKSQVAFSTITNDQVSVSGTINPTFTFTLSGNASTFTTITNSVSDASPTPSVSVVTNARNGWTAWVKDANNGTLNSVGAGASIPIPGAVGGASYNLATMTATGAFGLGVTNTGGSPTLDAAYNGTSSGYAGTLSNAFTRIAYSNTYSSADQVTLIPRAIAKTTQAPASDYTDTLTVIAAGQF